MSDFSFNSLHFLFKSAHFTPILASHPHLTPILMSPNTTFPYIRLLITHNHPISRPLSMSTLPNPSFYVNLPAQCQIYQPFYPIFTPVLNGIPYSQCHLVLDPILHPSNPPFNHQTSLLTLHTWHLPTHVPFNTPNYPHFHFSNLRISPDHTHL